MGIDQSLRRIKIKRPADFSANSLTLDQECAIIILELAWVYHGYDALVLRKLRFEPAIWPLVYQRQSITTINEHFFVHTIVWQRVHCTNHC